MPDLVALADLADFPGAPFAESVVRSASESVRDEAGWHIAPVLTETLVVRSDGGRDLFLKSLHVTAITEITHDGSPVTNWDDDLELFREGIVHREYGWPVGILRVSVTHGYDACPPALLSVIAERCQQAGIDSTVSQMGRGPFTVSLRAKVDTTASDAILARYTVPAGP